MLCLRKWKGFRSAHRVWLLTATPPSTSWTNRINPWWIRTSERGVRQGQRNFFGVRSQDPGAKCWIDRDYCSTPGCILQCGIGEYSLYFSYCVLSSRILLIRFLFPFLPHFLLVGLIHMQKIVCVNSRPRIWLLFSESCKIMNCPSLFNINRYAFIREAICIQEVTCAKSVLLPTTRLWFRKFFFSW